MADNKAWASHAEFVVILLTLLGGFYLLDGKIERCTQAQSSRTDRLYEMFIELVKENKR
jgi:hypothetical protein